MKKTAFMMLIVTCSIQAHAQSGKSTFKRPYLAPNNMVPGGQFIDRFLPMESQGELTFNTWGGDNVLPRDVLNGMEDMEHSYWGGNIVKGDDDKFHLFVCRWREDNEIGTRSGHMTWGSSEVVHAISDQATGPYKVKEVVGGGHNPEIYRRQDGSYILGVMGDKAYSAPSLDGPWTKIKPTFQWMTCDESRENRTYAVREDGATLMMAKDGYMHISEHGDEDFVQVTHKHAMRSYPHSIMEDPVIWRDEVQYNCVYNDALGRTAFYMRSKDGIHWKWMEGVAYNPRVVKHADGSYEDWHKMERPKVLQDEWGRATHMNFAAMDGAKWDDKANDKHSSKNVVMPLRVPRRLEILNSERLTQDTAEIILRIRAEEGFNPITDVDVGSLKFGAPEVVNFGGGSSAIRSEKAGGDLIVTFAGKGNGFEAHNFAGKLVGFDADGELLFGYAKMKSAVMQDKVLTHTQFDEVSVSGKMRFAVTYQTTEERLLKVALIDRTTGKPVKGHGERVVNGDSTDVVHYASEAPLNLKHAYQLNLSLLDLKTGKPIIKVVKKNLVTVPLNAPKDAIGEMTGPWAMPDRGTLLIPVDYEAKTKRDLHVEFRQTNPSWVVLDEGPVATVEGTGTAVIEFEVKPEYELQVGKKYLFWIFTTKAGEKRDKRVSNRVWHSVPVMDAEAFKKKYPQSFK